MGSFANSLFTLMLGWLQGAVSAVWSAFTSQNGSSFLNWIGRRWILIAAVLCAIGLAADLCVYILRWKPFRVWKSFFTRKEPDSETEDGDTGSIRPGFRREEPEYTNRNEKTEPVFKRQAERDPEPDLSQWEPEEGPAETDVVSHAVKPPMVTNAGYVVPADSPYRRPAGEAVEENIQVQERTTDDIPAAGQDRNEPSPVVQRRRRRISVTELFSDPEEELRQFDAPQQVIDSRRAYHAPVYPRGWKKNEEDGE